MVVIIGQVVLSFRGSKVGFVPANSLTVGFECIVFVPTPSSKFFIGPIEDFSIGFAVTGGKFWIYKRFPSRHDVL